MKVRIKHGKSILIKLFLGALTFMTLFLAVAIDSTITLGGNVTNQTVISQVNVSNTEPILYRVDIISPLDGLGNIDLGAGNTTTVICNGSFSDVNGFGDVVGVNATLFRTSVASNATDDNNTHYTNSTCLASGQSCFQDDGLANNASCTCQFAVQYFADSGNWKCNMTINDSVGITSIANSSDTFLNEILGIEVSVLTIDYGNLSVTQTSEQIVQNITNVGNVPLNITVRGYGGNNETLGQNVTMVCDPSVALANISFDSQRFHYYNNTPFADMYNLTNQTKQIAGLTIPKRTNNTWLGNSSNVTYWRLQIPLGAAGLCNGTIIFGGVDATSN